MLVKTYKMNSFSVYWHFDLKIGRLYLEFYFVFDNHQPEAPPQAFYFKLGIHFCRMCKKIIVRLTESEAIIALSYRPKEIRCTHIQHSCIIFNKHTKIRFSSPIILSFTMLLMLSFARCKVAILFRSLLAIFKDINSQRHTIEICSSQLTFSIILIISKGTFLRYELYRYAWFSYRLWIKFFMKTNSVLFDKIGRYVSRSSRENISSCLCFPFLFTAVS